MNKPSLYSRTSNLSSANHSFSFPICLYIFVDVRTLVYCGKISILLTIYPSLNANVICESSLTVKILLMTISIENLSRQMAQLQFLLIFYLKIHNLDLSAKPRRLENMIYGKWPTYPPSLFAGSWPGLTPRIYVDTAYSFCAFVM